VEALHVNPPRRCVNRYRTDRNTLTGGGLAV
jgi:hypothetical protein